MARGWVAGVVLVALGLKGYGLGYGLRGRPLRGVSRVCEGMREGGYEGERRTGQLGWETAKEEGEVIEDRGKANGGKTREKSGNRNGER